MPTTTMQPFPTEPAEPTYAITVDPTNEAAERWYWQADAADLADRTLASARDLAHDTGSLATPGARASAERHGLRMRRAA